MGKVIKLSESDLVNIVKSVMNEQKNYVTNYDSKYDYMKDGDNYYFKLKNQKTYRLATGTGREAIKTKVFGSTKPVEPVKKFTGLNTGRLGQQGGYSGYQDNLQTKPIVANPVTQKKSEIEKKAETVGTKYNYTPRIDAELKYIAERKLNNKPFFVYDPKFNLLYLFDTGSKYVLHTQVVDGANEQNESLGGQKTYTHADWCKNSPVPGDDAKGQKLEASPRLCTASNFKTKESCVKDSRRRWDDKQKICIADAAYFVVDHYKERFLAKGIYNISSLGRDEGYTGKGINKFNLKDQEGKQTAAAIHGIPNMEERLTASEDLRKVLKADLSAGKVPKEYLNSIKLIANANQSYGCVGVPAKFIEDPRVQKLARGARVFAMGDKGTSYLVQNAPTYFEQLGGDGEVCKSPIMVAQQLSGGDETSTMAESIISESVKKVLSNVLSNFKAEANVEDDMVMQFRVKGLSYIDGDVGMTIEDPTTKKDLIVWNFQGPIRDSQTNKVVYKRSVFKNINKNNYQQIARTYKIEMVST